jgi:PadR family transcriptional regulator
VAKGSAPSKTDVLQGTLDLMVLQTLDTMGPLHGYGIARRIEQISDAVLTLNEGTVYASLMRLQQQGWISASWGIPTTIGKQSSTPSREAVVGS